MPDWHIPCFANLLIVRDYLDYLNARLANLLIIDAFRGYTLLGGISKIQGAQIQQATSGAQEATTALWQQLFTLLKSNSELCSPLSIRTLALGHLREARVGEGARGRALSRRLQVVTLL